MTPFFPIETSRLAALRSKVMAGLAHHPLIARLDDSQVCLVEAFCRYMKENIVTDLDLEYIRGFAMIAAASPDDLVHLGAALRIFGMPAADHFDTVSEELLHATNRPRIHKGNKRTYQRSVSVAPEDLPAEWREALANMKAGLKGGIDAPAPSIQTRLTQRLCMFAWSAQRAGRPIDLADEEALQAFYRDLEARSAAKYTSGPREATLRNSFEELHRFARYMGAPDTVISSLHFTYELLCIAEGAQDQLKWLKIEGQSSDVVLAAARDRLARSRTAPSAAERQKLRNEAMALIVGFYVAPRPADFQNFAFGDSVFFDAERGRYSFIYIQQKTNHRSGVPREVHLPPKASPYFDAVILRDAADDLIETLRAKAMHDKRPLTIHDNDEPVAYGWYSRVFKGVIETGGHAMRAIRVSEILAANPNPAGMEMARLTTGHASLHHIEKYASVEIIEANSIAEAKARLRRRL